MFLLFQQNFRKQVLLYNCLPQAEQYCSIKSILMYRTFLWLCKSSDEKLANSTAAEILADAYLPLSPVTNNISPNVHRHAVFLFSTQHNKQCKKEYPRLQVGLQTSQRKPNSHSVHFLMY